MATGLGHKTPFVTSLSLHQYSYSTSFHKMPKPISSRLQVEDGSTPAKSKQKQPIQGFQSLTNVQGRFKPQRVSSSTTPSRQGSSEAVSDDAQTVYGGIATTYGAADVQMTGMDRHMLGMLESSDITAAEADSYFDSYFS
jgi:hypothetical protein